METTGQSGKQRICPSCGTENPGIALFCGECGFALRMPRPCPSCGVPLASDADLCEVCGTMTGGEGCRFCGGVLERTAPFCPDCGNPSAGIACPSCGTRSFFDFCPSCGIPLTEAAASELRKVAVEARNRPFDEAEDLERLKSYISGTRSRTAPPKSSLGEKPSLFATNREARLYHMARKPEGPAFWRCAADGREHITPAACSRPRYGGIWIIGVSG